jgi:Transposase IS116/IS110/IS902 family
MVHVGVDLDKRRSQIAVLTEEGEISQQRLPNDPVRLEKFFAELPPHTLPWRSKPPAPGGGSSISSNISATTRSSRTPSRPKPSPRPASRTIAWTLSASPCCSRGDLLPTVWIPSAALREARELVRHRVQLVWRRGIVRNRLHAMLARRNLQPVSTKTWLTQRGQRELQRVPLADTPSRIREDCSALLPLLDAQIRRLDGELGARWGHAPRVPRLTTIPGIGPFIAIVLVLELGDIARFPSAQPVASYVGLTPRIRASAGRIRAGHISKEGNRLLRWVLVLAATQAGRRPGPLRTWFHAVKKRRARKSPGSRWRADSRRSSFTSGNTSAITSPSSVTVSCGELGR